MSKRVPTERLRAEIDGVFAGGEDLARAIERVARAQRVRAKQSTGRASPRWQRASTNPGSRAPRWSNSSFPSTRVVTRARRSSGSSRRSDVRITPTRQPHQREGHERYTVDAVIAEEQRVFDMIDLPAHPRSRSLRLRQLLRALPQRPTESTFLPVLRHPTRPTPPHSRATPRPATGARKPAANAASSNASS